MIIYHAGGEAMKKRVMVYLTDEMHKELKGQAKSLGLDMGAYVVHLLMRERERSRNEQIVKDLVDATKKVINDPKILNQI